MGDTRDRKKDEKSSSDRPFTDSDLVNAENGLLKRRKELKASQSKQVVDPVAVKAAEEALRAGESSVLAIKEAIEDPGKKEAAEEARQKAIDAADHARSVKDTRVAEHIFNNNKNLLIGLAKDVYLNLPEKNKGGISKFLNSLFYFQQEATDLIMKDEGFLGFSPDMLLCLTQMIYNDPELTEFTHSDEINYDKINGILKSVEAMAEAFFAEKNSQYPKTDSFLKAKSKEAKEAKAEEDQKEWDYATRLTHANELCNQRAKALQFFLEFGVPKPSLESESLKETKPSSESESLKETKPSSESESLKETKPSSESESLKETKPSSESYLQKMKSFFSSRPKNLIEPENLIDGYVASFIQFDEKTFFTQIKAMIPKKDKDIPAVKIILIFLEKYLKRIESIRKEEKNIIIPFPAELKDKEALDEFITKFVDNQDKSRTNISKKEFCNVLMKTIQDYTKEYPIKNYMLGLLQAILIMRSIDLPPTKTLVPSISKPQFFTQPQATTDSLSSPGTPSSDSGGEPEKSPKTSGQIT